MDAAENVQWDHPTIRFPGQYYDEETGLHYNKFRYYDPSIGRYISADPIGQFGALAADGVALSRMVPLPGQAPPDPLQLFGAGTNLYGYASNNPTNLIDPTGEFAFTAAFGAAGAAIGGLANLGYQYGRGCGFDQDQFFNAVAGGALAGAVTGLVVDTAGVAGVAVAGSGTIGAGTLSASGAALFGAGGFVFGFDYGEQVKARDEAGEEGCGCDE